ncbi:TrmH family RNA methyltransferase [Bifidobacterium simiarum]|uniref:TrmH family RNA methyltransferase n=1 Tax=Bifidobacterium simiarum TaxID=2045441 RepID=UPI001BDCF4DE|nr:RNA methyltransferase [Bifidobacterium simiarum]MBT1165808.1 RNA methyltransferase [Bifidobacterium simiarum]
MLDTYGILYDETLDNPDATRIKRVAELMKSRGRRKAGKFLIEAPQAVREALACRADLVEDLYVEVDGEGSPVSERAGEIEREILTGTPERVPAGARRVFIHHVSSRVMASITTDAQGVFAIADMGDLVGPLADFSLYESIGRAEGARGTDSAEGSAAHVPMVAAFWQVRDPGNAGTVIRTADAAGADAVVLVDDCVTPYSPKVIRSTAGSLFHIPVLRASVDDFFEWCASSGLTTMAADVYGTETTKPRSLSELIAAPRGGDDSRSGRAVLFGNEARGLETPILERCNDIVSIPIYGRAESLNLATSASVLLYSLAMRDRA